ncbi:hypothetical protein [Aliikangiella sp. G2MR2-5]|uniref:hypothetical protein n=1 Tax=Aliikangiella sp. G2MR2-5 TaxID=2788943 RepID=UPI0018AB61A9|nr:hypothetical protein [Aliikangiella sp. G2MR2-5]
MANIMEWLRYSSSILLVFILLAKASFCHGATQGEFGSNSQGDVEITLTLGLLTRITGLADINFGNWTGGSLTSDQNICIGLYGTNNYRITATGSGDNSNVNSFALSNGVDYLPYRVFYNDTSSTSGRVELVSAQPLTGQTASNAFWNIFGCLTTNANLSMLIEEPALLSVPPASYTGTLTLTIIPE